MDIVTILPGFPGKADRGFFGWCNVLLLDTSREMMVIDTGSHGDRAVLQEQLAARGIDAAQITRLFITHLHFDHCLNVDLFPNAEIIIGAKEWEYAWSTFPEQRGDTFVPRQYLPYLASRKPLLVVEGDCLAPGIKVLELPGHTPGCMGLHLIQQGVVVAGDAIKNLREFTCRDPGLCFDSPKTAVASIDRVADLAGTVFPGHDSPFTISAGEVRRRSAPKVIVTHYAAVQAPDGTREEIPRSGGER